MKARNQPPAPPAAAEYERLRAQAEARAAPDSAAATPAHTASALRHELQVHRIELEMQNEELRRAQVALEAARDRYVDLYDFAPVGYLTLDRSGIVGEANLTAARLLGIERARLLGRRFSRQVAPADRDRWHRHLAALAGADAPSRIELLLLGPDGLHWHAQLDSLRVPAAGAGASLRITLTDISARKRAELYQRAAAAAIGTREADSRRLALQLHEDLGQRLCALKLDLEDLQAAEDRPARHARMDALRAELEQALATVRRMSAELRPAMLDDLGLNAAIEWLVRDTSQRLGIAVALTHDEIEPPLDDASAVAVYRLVQAVLVEHLAERKPAGEAMLSMQRQASGLVLCLQARALESALPDEAATLREHVLALGGQLALETSAPAGPRLVVRLPLEPAPPGRRLRLAGAL